MLKPSPIGRFVLLQVLFVLIFINVLYAQDITATGKFQSESTTNTRLVRYSWSAPAGPVKQGGASRGQEGIAGMTYGGFAGGQPDAGYKTFSNIPAQSPYIPPYMQNRLLRQKSVSRQPTVLPAFSGTSSNVSSNKTQGSVAVPSYGFNDPVGYSDESTGSHSPPPVRVADPDYQRDLSGQADKGPFIRQLVENRGEVEGRLRQYLSQYDTVLSGDADKSGRDGSLVYRFEQALSTGPKGVKVFQEIEQWSGPGYFYTSMGSVLSVN